MNVSFFKSLILIPIISASTKLHYSMENLSKIRASSSSATSSSSASSTSCAAAAVAAGSQSTSPASSFMSSRSCDSIYSMQKAKINPKLPTMPNGTANILDRTPNKKPQQQQQQQQSARSRGAAATAAVASKKEIMSHHQ